MSENYYLGLDMGTGSVGWAVTDESYNIIKKHGIALWGVRLFDGAQTAEERRMHRTSRRRIERRKRRIELLQDIFAEEIVKKDPGFYQRLKESRYTPEDKKDLNGSMPSLPYSLFVDEDFTDKDFHKKYPTIYHLRNALIKDTNTAFDVRLVYLAIHHIIKHRGHFLFEGRDMQSIENFKDAFDGLRAALENNEWEIFFSDEQISQTENILKNRKLGKSAKKIELIKAWRVNDSQDKELAALLAGGTVKLSVLFEDEELKNAERAKISFSDASYEDYIGDVEELLNERFQVIETAKAIYDWAILADILGGKKYLSEAKTDIYKTHQKDLKELKLLLKQDKVLYNQVFGAPKNKEANYSAYVGIAKRNGTKEIIEKQCSKQEFYEFIKKILKKLPENDVVTGIKDKIDAGIYMPKQVLKDNSVIPYQINEMELSAIVENAGRYLPFLHMKDKDGYSNADKIKAIFQYRVPYYVGPINTFHKDKGANCWAVRRRNGKIYPWNFSEMIDEEASAKEFIDRMTNKCTYLIGKDVLPKESLLYSKFTVLNELNNLKIDEEPISVELKQKIYTDLFMRTRNVTGKKLRNYLIAGGYISREQELSGFNPNFSSSLKSYLDMKEILTDSNISEIEIEDIIKDITLFSSSPQMLRNRIKKKYPSLTDRQVKALTDKKYSGWGALSKEFLEEVLAPDVETGEAVNIITQLWNTNYNLMQLLGKDFLFSQSIDDINNERDHDKTITYEDVRNLYVSPAVKRPIWQTLKIVKEIEKFMGGPAKRIFVEMAREKEPNKTNISRKKRLLGLYEACKKEEPELYKALSATEESKFRGDKLYLYYMQRGRCMYSGEIIDIENLFSNNYDIDHIYPQSKVMDDSLVNRVLVKKSLNEEKTDIYPISADIQNKCRIFWKGLLEQGLIEEEKYKRLTRITPFSEGELAGFIARQLVETRQSTKAIASLLKKSYENTEIVYVKAGIVSQFRNDFKLIKVRDMNDYHHAKDAYLNIVVGNTYYIKFTKDAAWFIRNNPGRTYNISKMFTGKYDVERNGETAWKSGEDGTIVTVKEVMRKNNILFTRRSYEAHGGLFDQQLMKKGDGQVPIKGSDERLHNISAYGGYNKAAGAYFMLLESLDKKGNRKKTIEFVPIYKTDELQNSQEKMLQYCISQLELVCPRILIPKIKLDSLFCVDGFYMHLSGRTGNQLIFKNANELVVNQSMERVLKKVIKFCGRLKENSDIELSKYDELTEVDLIALYNVFLDKLQNSIYGKRYDTQRKLLDERTDDFLSLCVKDKVMVLCEIIHLFKCDSSAADLSLVSGPKKAGILVMSKDITKLDNIKLLEQSVTGIYSKKVDLAKL